MYWYQHVRKQLPRPPTQSAYTMLCRVDMYIPNGVARETFGSCQQRSTCSATGDAHGLAKALPSEDTGADGVQHMPYNEVPEEQTCLRPPTETQFLQHGISTGCASTAMENRVPVIGQQCEAAVRSPLPYVFIAAAWPDLARVKRDCVRCRCLPALSGNIDSKDRAERTNNKHDSDIRNTSITIMRKRSRIATHCIDRPPCWAQYQNVPSRLA